MPINKPNNYKKLGLCAYLFGTSHRLAPAKMLTRDGTAGVSRLTAYVIQIMSASFPSKVLTL